MEYNLPPDLRSMFEAIYERLRALETAPKSRSTSIADDNGNVVVRMTPEGFEIYDANGVLRCRLGFISETAGYGAQVFDAAGGLRFEVNDDGFKDPYLTVPFIPTLVAFTGLYTPITSGSYQIVYRARFENTSHIGLFSSVIATGDTATTGDFRLRNATTGSVTSAVAVGAGAVVEQQFKWLHGSSLGTGPTIIDVEARRLTGANNINVYLPGGVTMTDPGLCTASGV